MIELDLTLPRIFADGSGELQLRLSLETNSLTAFYGASGAGKTTLLRLLAGLETPVSGRIVVDGETWLDTSQRINVPVQKRSIGFVFQDAALFPNMTVRENLAYAAFSPKDAFIDELLELIKLGSLGARKPDGLSGGQRQRVALARALVRRPKVLLLDEPFASLDATTAQSLREVLGHLHQQFQTTTLLVTHSQEDIRQLADRKVEIERGRVKVDEVKGPESAPISGIITKLDRENGYLETDTMQIRLGASAAWPNDLKVGDEVSLLWEKRI
jgi:molybdate transport system ATP-binding protein